MASKRGRPSPVSRDDFAVLCQWLKLLNKQGWFEYYATRCSASNNLWASHLRSAHTEVLSHWPTLHGRLAKSVIGRAVEAYIDKFPFLDKSQSLPSSAFLHAMTLVDEAQVALKIGAAAPICPQCVQLQMRLRLMERQNKDSAATTLPDGDEGLLLLMKQIYDDLFLHGCGCTPREFVRRKMIDAVASEINLDLTQQRDLWQRFLSEQLIDAAQRDSKFIHCCPRHFD